MPKIRQPFCFLIPIVAFVVLLTFMAGCERQKTAKTEENKAIARLFWQEGWKQGNQAVFDEICAIGLVNHDPTLPQVISLEAYKEHVALHATAFPADAGVDIEDLIAEGDKVAVRWTWRVTHEGEYMAVPPTGNQVTMTGITIHRFADGKVAENWHNYDALGFMQQLGIVPPMGREDFTWGGAMEEVTDAPGDIEGNKAIYRREAEELWNQRSLTVADEVFATNFVNHDPNHPEVRDLEGFKQFVTMCHTEWPDFHVTTEDMVAEGHKVVTRWTVTGTHEGGAFGVPPTGKQMRWTGITINRFAGGRVVEAWWSRDALGLMQQMGVIPPLGQGGE